MKSLRSLALLVAATCAPAQAPPEAAPISPPPQYADTIDLRDGSKLVYTEVETRSDTDPFFVAVAVYRGDALQRILIDSDDAQSVRDTAFLRHEVVLEQVLGYDGSRRWTFDCRTPDPDRATLSTCVHNDISMRYIQQHLWRKNMHERLLAERR